MAECNIKQKNMLQLAEYQRSLWRHPNLRFLFFSVKIIPEVYCILIYIPEHFQCKG